MNEQWKLSQQPRDFISLASPPVHNNSSISTTATDMVWEALVSRGAEKFDSLYCPKKLQSVLLWPSESRSKSGELYHATEVATRHPFYEDMFLMSGHHYSMTWMLEVAGMQHPPWYEDACALDLDSPRELGGIPFLLVLLPAPVPHRILCS